MNVKVKHDVNGRDLRIWTFSNPDTETCGTVYSFGERMKRFSFQVNANTQLVNSDGVTVGSYTGSPNGTGSFGLTELTAAEREMVLGNKVVSGTGDFEVVQVGERDIAPYIRAAWISDLEDGKVNLYKILRMQCAPYEKAVDQVNESGQVTFSTITLPFTFFNSFSSTVGGKLYEAKAVDPTTTAGAAFINNWMTTGDFIGVSTFGGGG
jgi:hypothetical protein